MNTIESANAAFEALSPEDKRVAIARDALAQIACGFIRPTHGTYESYGGGSATEAIACRACAVGTLLRGALVKSRRGRGAESWPDYLRGFFSNTQLALIECAFEGFDASGFDRYKKGHTRPFRRYVIGPRTRAKLILRNIVRNGGCFLPEDPVMLKTIARLPAGAP